MAGEGNGTFPQMADQLAGRVSGGKVGGGRGGGWNGVGRQHNVCTNDLVKANEWVKYQIAKTRLY